MTPRATYRLQFHEEFTFADAEGLVPYLAQLGVSHIYASPITTAVRGSRHGYGWIIPAAELFAAGPVHVAPHATA